MPRNKDDNDEEAIVADSAGSIHGLPAPSMLGQPNGGLPPSAAAAQTLTDLVEYYVELINMDKERRIEHWNALRVSWEM